LEKDRNLRYQHASDVRTDLQRLKRDTESVKSAGIIGMVGVPQRRWWRKKAAISGTVLFISALVVAATVYYNQRTSNPGPIDSVAVLPLATNSTDQNTQFLSDGITDSLIESLSQIPHLKVMSRSSVFHYKGREIDPQAVGRELKVKAVLTGRLVQHDDNLFLSTELVNASDDSHIWGEEFNRKASDILPLQQELAQIIAQKLRVKLSSGQQQAFARQGTQNPEAYALYVRGRSSWDQLTEKSLKEAIDFFQQAIDKDPGYAAAYAEMSRSYTMLGHSGYLPGTEAYPKAIATAKRAIDLDSNLAEGHVALGHAAFITWNWALAESELRRAIELNPSLSEAHLEYAVYLLNIGRVPDASTEVRLAQEFDPLSLGPSNILAWAFTAQRDYDNAIAQFNKSIEMRPNSAAAHYSLFDLYSVKLMYDNAVAQLEQALTLDGRGLEASAVDATYKSDGYKGVLRTTIQINGNPSSKHYDPAAVAQGYTLLGNRDQAFAWLDKAYEARLGLNFIKVNPVWDNLRSDPRFTDVLRRMGLPQ
jgi:TolB-like protein